MGKLKMLAMALLMAGFLNSCMGDHSSRHGMDTEKNIYGVKRDTSKGDSTGADTASLDNSASGGTKLVKPDSSKK